MEMTWTEVSLAYNNENAYQHTEFYLHIIT